MDLKIALFAEKVSSFWNWLPFFMFFFFFFFENRVEPITNIGSYIRDSTHMTNILQDFKITPNMLLCTLDITSLYTNIPHDEGVQAIKELLAIHRDIQALPHNSYIIELLQVVLTNNYFDFNGRHYHQKSGTAMGTKLAP